MAVDELKVYGYICTRKDADFYADICYFAFATLIMFVVSCGTFYAIKDAIKDNQYNLSCLNDKDYITIEGDLLI